jgi:hypothetical protein
MRNAQHGRWVLGLAVCLYGCAAPFGRLDGVLVEAQPEPRPIKPDEAGRVQVVRQGQAQPGRAGMSLKKNDGITTSADGVALLNLAAGFEIILKPGTDVTIENPKILLRFGGMIVKRIRKVRQALTVQTTLVAAVTEGTEFVLEVDSQPRATLTVIEGRVKVYPRAARWTDTTYYSQGDRVVFDSLGISQLAALEAVEVSVLERRIAAIERVAKPPAPIWQKPAFLVPAAVAVGVAVYFVTRNQDESTSGGTVIIHIPF